MDIIQENISLRPYNSFGINARARYFAAFDGVETLTSLLKDTLPALSTESTVLGGGSNVLFTKDYDGAILKNNIQGIDIIKEETEHVFVKVGAGVNWHEFVMYCIGHNLAGVENLALIPGTVGASPMQNIGAYGVELKDTFYSLEALHRGDLHLQNFTNNDCEFGYRESVFKNKYREEFVITSVTFQLNKQPTYNTSYGAIASELESMGIKELNIRAIANAVIRIRQSKLPDPKEVGNAGSFFKNPEVDINLFGELRQKFHGIVGYNLANGNAKLAAGWLIEQCGWKGFRDGDAGCHIRQALVLVNYGNASGRDILTLSSKIIASVYEKFGVRLQQEVNIIY